MSCKKRILAIVAMLLAVVAIALVRASPETAISIDPAQVKELESGTSFTVSVTITEAVNIYGWQANITFDPGVLSVTNVAEGPFLENVNDTVWPTPRIDNDKGLVLASSSLMPPYPSKGVDGSGTLANITFTVKSGGSTALHFDAEGTYLRTVIAGVVTPPIEDYATNDGQFVGTGGTGFPQIPIEILAGAIAAVVVVVVVVVFLLRRRRR